MSQIVGNGFFASDAPNGVTAPWLALNGGASGAYPMGSPANARWGSAADGVRPAWVGGSNVLDAMQSSLPGLNLASTGSSSILSILGQLASMVQQYIGKLSGSMYGTPSAPRPVGASTFQNVSLASTGDPHLSISGSAVHADGSAASVDSHYDSMTSHADLFSTNDFGNGFTVSTNVTQPAANGITQNASATASMDGGLNAVTMNANGSVSVTSGGMTMALAPNQSLQLANGATVSEAETGAVSISDHAYGTNLTTTFNANGTGGVDVNATGSNVTLAGDLVASR